MYLNIEVKLNVFFSIKYDISHFIKPINKILDLKNPISVNYEMGFGIYYSVTVSMGNGI